MASPTRYVKGDWKAVCDVCGQRFLASELRKRWDGLMVCSKDYEPRHPQEFVKARVDHQAVPWSRPESETYSYVAIDYDRTIEDTFVLRELLSKVIGKLTADTLSMTESVTTLRILHGYPTDTFSLTEALSKSPSKVITEIITLSETFNNSPFDYEVESLSLTESISKVFSKSIAESIPLSESLPTLLFTPGVHPINKYAINTYSLGSGVRRVTTRSLPDTFSITEGVTTTVGFVRTSVDTVTITEVVTKTSFTQGTNPLNKLAINSHSIG